MFPTKLLDLAAFQLSITNEGFLMEYLFASAGHSVELVKFSRSKAKHIFTEFGVSSGHVFQPRLNFSPAVW